MTNPSFCFFYSNVIIYLDILIHACKLIFFGKKEESINIYHLTFLFVIFSLYFCANSNEKSYLFLHLEEIEVDHINGKKLSDMKTNG